MYDTMILLPFIATLASSRRWLFRGSVFLGACVGELYSAMPFGFFLLSYVVSLTALKFSVKFFNLSSPVSVVLIFSIAILLFTVVTTIIYAAYFHVWSSETALRGIMWGLRQFLAGATVSMIWWAFVYSLSLVRNAFVEEKISYS